MDAPEIEKFNEIDAHTLEIIMKEPVYWRGEFLGFSIEMRENPLELNPPWNFALSRAKNRLTYLVEELKSNTRYEFRVRGNVAPYGFSDYSKVYVFHTLNESKSHSLPFSFNYVSYVSIITSIGNNFCTFRFDLSLNIVLK